MHLFACLMVFDFTYFLFFKNLHECGAGLEQGRVELGFSLQELLERSIWAFFPIQQPALQFLQQTQRLVFLFLAHH